MTSQRRYDDVIPKILAGVQVLQRNYHRATMKFKAALTRSDFVEFDYVESSFASDLSNRIPLLQDQILLNKIGVKCLISVYEME